MQPQLRFMELAEVLEDAQIRFGQRRHVPQQYRQ
jgi:hypothetical protein